MQKRECIEIFERYILNQATPEEIKYLNSWIRNNKEISTWLENQILNSSSKIDSEVQLRMLKNIEKKIDIDNNNSITDVSKTTNHQLTSRFRLKKWMRVAAMIILPILTAASVYFYMSYRSDIKSDSLHQLVVSVERGQKANITLPDGSKVWLNSQSKLTYSQNFNVKERRLQLDGDAFFDVAHNPDKPFIVQSNDISVEALGTAFEVKAYSDDNLVTSILIRGKIRVTTPNGETILTPNEMVSYNKSTGKLLQSSLIGTKDFTGWMHNQLHFENESLANIAKVIERTYNVKVIFTSENLKNQHYTGTVENNSLENFLNIISLTSPVSFQIKDQKVILSENLKLLNLYTQ